MRVAIFGVGQLARMLSQAAETLNIECVFIRTEHESTQPVDGLGEVINLDAYRDARGELDVAAFYDGLGKPQVITVEKEDVPIAVLNALSAFCPVHPNPEAVEVTQHRGREKNCLKALSIPTTRFYLAYEASALVDGADEVGYPIFVKSLESGYDGKHQWYVTKESDLEAVKNDFPDGGVVLEAKVDFQREVSFIAARSRGGDIRFYPATENRHEGGVLLTSVAPAPNLSDAFIEKGQRYIKTLLEHWQYVGVLAMECFVAGDELLVNELAPRVHNSGHWTMLPGVTSQFENHMRAICDLALGEADIQGHFGMVNILGHYDHEQHQSLLAEKSAEFHWYQKTPKPRRKVGHINLFNVSEAQLLADMSSIEKSIYD